uniref:Uncharacterized protein n=1 Tax=Tanacetum cinerariifolium TaxID=118510 RepID=A0A6L2J9C7_TANCI|nr:hypothetical protein [Tanacetum cinerariifolium]
MLRSVHTHRILSSVAVKFGERENNEAWETNCNHTRRRRSHMKIFTGGSLDHRNDEMALLLLGLDISENRNFTPLIVMPLTRAPGLAELASLILGKVFVERNVAKFKGFFIVA